MIKIVIDYYFKSSHDAIFPHMQSTRRAWDGRIVSGRRLCQAFVVHGEEPAAMAFTDEFRARNGWP